MDSLNHRRRTRSRLGLCDETLQRFYTTPPSIVTAVAMIGSVVLLSVAMRTIPLGTAYVIWTGIGAVGAFLVGIIWLGEALTPMRLTAALLIISGLLLMKWTEY